VAGAAPRIEVVLLDYDRRAATFLHLQEPGVDVPLREVLDELVADMIVANASNGVRIPAEVCKDCEDVAARPTRESLLGGGGPD